jgi:hypothetical protein
MKADAAEARRQDRLGESVPAGLAKYARSFEGAARAVQAGPGTQQDGAQSTLPLEAPPPVRTPPGIPSGWSDVLAELGATSDDPIFPAWLPLVWLAGVRDGTARLVTGARLGWEKLREPERFGRLERACTRHLPAVTRVVLDHDPVTARALETRP